MHGRKRTEREDLDPPEVRAAKTEKYKQYLQGCKVALQSDETAQRAEKLLRYNPDFFTLWNSRRRLILKDQSASGDGSSLKEWKLTTLERELNLTKDQIAQRNSKSYGAWFHRRWSIETLGFHEGSIIFDLESELSLCDMLLTRDERNFHCWAHRNFIASLAKVSNASDIQKSLELIQKNFSNYSAWHLRVQAITKEGGLFNNFDDEFELVHQAVFTEPADQSAWLYFRWLLTCPKALSEGRLNQERDIIDSLLEEEGDCKWPLLAIIQLLSLMPPSDAMIKQAMDICARLKRVDPAHSQFYMYLSTLFEVSNFNKLSKVLFVSKQLY